MFTHFLKSDENGAVSVEFAMWTVLMVLILALAADSSMLLAKHSELFDVARDVARQISLGIIEEHEVDTILALRWPNTSIYTAVIDEVNGFVVVSIRVPFADVMVFGEHFVGDSVLEGRVVMAKEA